MHIISTLIVAILSCVFQIVVRNQPDMGQLGFQEVHVGRGSVLTKYEPMVAGHKPVYNSVVDLGGGTLRLMD